VNSDAAERVREFEPLLREWSALWGVPELAGRLDVRFSGRFRTSLGRCTPAKAQIRLAAFLLEGSPALLREALCHEAAHAAAHALHGAGLRPHGDEWRALMRAAGQAPRARLPAELLPPLARRPRRVATLWELHCPVCHMARRVRRRDRRWRCAACRAAGLEGALVATRLGPPAAGSHGR